MRGQVSRVIAGFYDIIADGKEYRVRGSGNLRRLEESPQVGDFVEFEINGLISKIYERNNQLIRPKVSNVDQAVVVISLKEPNYSSFLLNKFLAIIEFCNIKPVIVFTKRDLVDASPVDEYRKQGYEVFEISNKSKNGIEDLKKIFVNKLTVFTGQTGAGKTSTINSLTDLERETQEISQALGRGKHTTRVVEMVPWNNGMLIDTPGFSSLELNMTKFELAQSFKQFRELSKMCKFKNCLHNKEVGCAVKHELERGNVSQDKYSDYLKLLEEAK